MGAFKVSRSWKYDHICFIFAGFDTFGIACDVRARFPYIDSNPLPTWIDCICLFMAASGKYSMAFDNRSS